MHDAPPTLAELAQYLRTTFAADRYATDEQGGIIQSADRPIQRLGLALDPTPTTGEWVRREHLDALWLHRPWRLHQQALPRGVGLFAHHLPFDETLTTGYNSWLADTLGLVDLEVIGYKPIKAQPGAVATQETDKNRPLGMVGRLAESGSGQLTHNDWLALIRREFGGYDRVEASPEQTRPGARPYERVAVVGAMNASLIYEAHERGVGLYLTGEYRKGTQSAVDETEITVIAIGHHRTEEWGLCALGALLQKQWPTVSVISYQ